MNSGLGNLNYSGNAYFYGGTGNILVNVNSLSNSGIINVVSGNNVGITTQASSMNINLNSTGNVTLAVDGLNNIVVSGLVTTGSLTITTPLNPASAINLFSSTTMQASSVNITTYTLLLSNYGNYNAVLQSTSGNINIQTTGIQFNNNGTSSNSDSIISAGNININSTTPGQIALTQNYGLGTASMIANNGAGNINFYGGSSSVSGAPTAGGTFSLSGIVGGTGTTFAITTNSGTLQLGTIAATTSATLGSSGNMTMASGNYIDSPTISLTSTAGSVGASGSPIYYENGSSGGIALTANASAASQNVYVQNASGATGVLTISGSSAAGGTFSATNSGNIVLSNSVSGSAVALTVGGSST